jgi:hypothetical protein
MCGLWAHGPGNCLTAMGWPIYGAKIVVMSGNPSSRPQSHPSLWCAGLCLLLAVLFLYNPFLTIYGTSQSQSVQHPLSYRGTVAGSELGRCTVDPSSTLLPVLQAAVACALVQPVVSRERKRSLAGEVVRVVPQVSFGSLWFRPPPSF